MTYHQYQIVGRAVPTPGTPNPAIYRMKIFAPNTVVGKSRFWYYVGRLKGVKKAKGEIMSVNEIFEKNPNTVKNFGVFIRLNSRSGTHNMYKEYRDTTLCGAVDQMYTEVASRHRARKSSVQIIKTAVVPASKCRRANTMQFHDSQIKFPLMKKIVRPSSKANRTVFKASRPNTFFSN